MCRREARLITGSGYGERERARARERERGGENRRVRAKG